MATKEFDIPSLNPIGTITDNTQGIAYDSTAVEAVKHKNFLFIKIREWLQSALVFLSGIRLNPSRIAMQEPIKASALPAGTYTIAESEQIANNVAGCTLRIVSESGIDLVEVDFKESASVKTHQNTTIKLLNANFGLVRLIASDSVNGAGSKIEITTDITTDLIVHMFSNSGTNKGFQLISPVLTNNLPPDGSLAAFLNVGGDPILSTDILIPVNGIVDSQGNRAVQKKISWNPWETWKTASITGDLRFPRGEAGVFGEYENLWDSPTPINAILSDVGDWTKIENSAGVLGYATQSLGSAQSSCYVSFRIKKGNEPTVLFRVTDSGSFNSAYLTFSTGNFTITGGSFDLLEAIEISDTDEYLIKLLKTGTLLNTDYLRIYPANSSTLGAFSYYKDISYVGGIDYPVPYVKGIHKADAWVHPVNWNESDEWVLFDAWIKPTNTTGVVFDTRLTTGAISRIWVEYNANQMRLVSGTYGGDSGAVIFSTQPVLLNYSHLKVVLISSASLNVYLNGSLVVTKNSNVPNVLNMSPIINIGMQSDGTNIFNGYFADAINIRPTADTSTTHYDLGLPWTNPENIMNSEHGNYEDKFGNKVVETLTSMEEDAYSVVEQYQIGDQTVTKWSNGDMEIRGIQSFTSIAFTTASGSMFRTASGSTINIPLLEQFFGGVSSVDVEMVGTTSPNLASIRPWDKLVESSVIVTTIGLSTTSQTVNGDVSYNTRGKWK